LRAARRDRAPTRRGSLQARRRGRGHRRRTRNSRPQSRHAGWLFDLRRSGSWLAGHAGSDGRVRNHVRLRQGYAGDGAAMAAVRAGWIEWAVAEHARQGQTESGDRSLAMASADGALVAVVDGLGHGAEAADVAKTAVRSLERHASEPVISLLRHCHGALSGTRGAVVSLAAFRARDETMTWVGVGNVEGLLVRGQATKSPQRELL